MSTGGASGFMMTQRDKDGAKREKHRMGRDTDCSWRSHLQLGDSAGLLVPLSPRDCQGDGVPVPPASDSLGDLEGNFMCVERTQKSHGFL